MNKYELTYQILKDCKEAGYHVVTIGKPDPKNNPACKGWPDGPYSLWAWNPSFEGNYNRGNDNTCRIGGWPAIWRIAEKHVAKGGCGNGHQHQISDTYNLVCGTYKVTFTLKTLKRQMVRLEQEEYLEKL